MRKMHFRLLPVLAVLAGLCVHCSSNHKSEEMAVSRAEADEAYAPAGVAADTIASSPTNTFPERQFVRTADLKFRVRDVAQTTHVVEDLTSRYGGFITQNHLSNAEVNTHSVQVTADTLLETTEYRVENNLSLRVPNQNLDSLLRELSRQIQFLDYRIVNADEVSLQLLENKLKLQRAVAAKNRYEKAIDGRGRKLGETLEGESGRLALGQEADASTLRNLALADQIRYSTVKLAVYQRTTRVQEKVAAPVYVPAYRPGLAAQLAEAFLDGWEIMEMLLVVITRLWALWGLGLLVWLGYRKFGVRVGARLLDK
jgi:hypothetical protein